MTSFGKFRGYFRIISLRAFEHRVARFSAAIRSRVMMWGRLTPPPPSKSRVAKYPSNCRVKWKFQTFCVWPNLWRRRWRIGHQDLFSVDKFSRAINRSLNFENRTSSFGVRRGGGGAAAVTECGNAACLASQTLPVALPKLNDANVKAPLGPIDVASSGYVNPIEPSANLVGLSWPTRLRAPGAHQAFLRMEHRDPAHYVCMNSNLPTI